MIEIVVTLVGLAVAVATGMAAGFAIGHRSGVRETEARWSAAVTRADATRARLLAHGGTPIFDYRPQVGERRRSTRLKSPMAADGSFDPDPMSTDGIETVTQEWDGSRWRDVPKEAA